MLSPERPDPRRLRRFAALALLSLLAAAPACGDGADGPGPSAWAAERSADPAVVDARRALDLRRPAQARPLVEEVAVAAGTEAGLLRARLLDLDGDLFGALRLLRQAQAERPGDPRPAAALVEILAWRGRLDEARTEFDAAVAAHGRTPELVRAHGVLGICTPGGAASGLELLLEAERADPELPFMDRALAAAFQLASQTALAAGDGAAALEFAERAYERHPADERVRECLADALAAGVDLSRAVQMYEALLAEGLPVEAKLTQALRGAATAAMLAVTGLQDADARELVNTKRERWYLRMVELGVARADLGYGLVFLEERADALANEAIELLDSIEALHRIHARTEAGSRSRADLEEKIAASSEKALGFVERALVLDPHSFKARALRAEIHMDAEQFTAAAQLFEGLCIEAGEAIDQLPLPVHIRASQAWQLAGDGERARDALLSYLATNPSGVWEQMTHAELEALPR